jgi:hypothetical protein
MAVLICVFFRRSGELNVSGGVGVVEIWVDVKVGGCNIGFIIMSMLILLCGLWVVR